MESYKSVPVGTEHKLSSATQRMLKAKTLEALLGKGR